MTKLVTSGVAARIVGCSRETIWRWVASGKIAAQRDERNWRWLSLDEVMDYALHHGPGMGFKDVVAPKMAAADDDGKL